MKCFKNFCFVYVSGANLQRNNIWGLYQPRDIKYLNINGVSYIITADTGAMKTWTVANEGIDFTDGQRARALSIGMNKQWRI